VAPGDSVADGLSAGGFGFLAALAPRGVIATPRDTFEGYETWR
jgi:hypothetical protein